MEFKHIGIALAGVLCSHAVSAQWGFNPAVNTPVSTETRDQQDIWIAPDAKGGAIITWLDYRNDTSGTADVYAQRLDVNGYPVWLHNGLPICTHPADQGAPAITEDGLGGAIISWNDQRNGNLDIYAQRIDSSGNILWQADGVPVATQIRPQRDSRLTYDGQGGAIVVWQDSVNGNWDIRAQRLSAADGSKVWPTDGAVVCGAFGFQLNPRVEPDWSGGATLVWQDRRNGADYDIYAQRVDSTGTVQWTTNGIIVASNAGTQNNPKIESDGVGGVIVVWQDDRTGNGFDIYAQRVAGNGSVLWTTNGIGVCTAAGSQSALDITTDGIQGCIVAWKDLRSGAVTDIYAQRLDLAGATKWSTGGVAIAVTSSNKNHPVVTGNGSGGAVIGWQDSTGGTWDIRAQSIDSNGVVLWQANGLAVGIAGDDQTDPKIVASIDGAVLFAWQDDRNGLDKDVYGHRIAADGTGSGLGEPQALRARFFPNPLVTTATLRISPLNDDVTIRFHDALGRPASFETFVAGGTALISRTDQRAGWYVCTVMSGLASTSFPILVAP